MDNNGIIQEACNLSSFDFATSFRCLLCCILLQTLSVKTVIFVLPPIYCSRQHKNKNTKSNTYVIPIVCLALIHVIRFMHYPSTYFYKIYVLTLQPRAILCSKTDQHFLQALKTVLQFFIKWPLFCLTNIHQVTVICALRTHYYSS